MLSINPESMNVFWTEPSFRMNGLELADLDILVEVRNSGTVAIDLEYAAVEISIKNDKGKLLVVETPSKVNDKNEIRLSPKATRNLKLIFHIPGVVYREIVTLSPLFALSIGDASIAGRLDFSQVITYQNSDDGD